MLDELEQRLLGPVNVLEDEHERLDVGELVGPGTGRPGDLLRAPLLLDGVEDAGGEREQVGDDLVLTALAQLLDRLADGVGVGDPGGRLDHLAERPVGDPLAVGQAAPGEHGRALERADELSDEAALADSRLAVDGDEVRAPVARGAVKGVGEQLELGLAADQRRDNGRAHRDLRAVDGADHAPGGELFSAALDLDRLDLLDLDHVERQPPRRRADQDLHRARGLLEPCCEVDRLAGRKTSSPPCRRRPRLTRSRPALRARASSRPRGSRSRRGSRARRRPRAPGQRRRRPALRRQRISRRCRRASSHSA